jgi:hypothetical protein
MNYCYNKLIIIGYPHRKLGLLLLLLVLTTKNNAFAQVVVNGGASITVTGNTVLSMDTLLNDTTANIVNSGAIKVKVIGNSGSLSGNGVYSVTATFSNNGAFSKDSSTVVYNGSSQSIPGAASGVSYFNLSLAGSGTKIFAADTTRISGAFTRTSVTADALTNAATIEYNGINQTVRAISYYNLCLGNKGIKSFETGSTNIKNTLSVADSVTADAITNSSTILYSGSVPQSVKTLNYFNLSLQGLAMKTFESDTSRIAGSFTASAAYVDAYTNNTTIEFNGGGTQTIPAITYYNLASSSTGNRTLAAASINVKHNFTPGSNTYTVPVNSTLLFSATSLQTIPAFAYYNLTLNNPHTVLGGNITVAKNLTLTDYDTLNLATYSAGGATGGLLKIPAHAAMYVPANNFPTGFGSYLLTGMVNYNGSDTETIYPATYAYLASSDTGSRILPNGDTVLVSGIFDPGTNGYIATGNTVNFNGTAVQTLPPLASSAYNNLVVSNRGRATLSGNVTVTGDVSLKNVSPFDVAGYSLTHTGTGGTFTVDSACTLYVGSSFPSNFGTYTLNGTVNFNGSGTQTIPALSYFNLTSSGTGSRILDSSATIYIRGLFSAGANSYTTTGSIVNFSGAAAQSVPGLSFNDLTLSNSAPVTLSGNVIVKNNLQLNGGQVATGTHNLALTNTAATALSRTTGYINGKLTRSTAANAAYVFPTGAADGYRPVKITPSSAANNSFSVEYKNNNPGTNGYYTDSVLTGVSRVNTAYYWKILRPTGSDSASIQMTIDTASFSAGAPIPVEWNGTKWKKLTGTSDSSGYTITATNIKLFGPFNFAYVAGSRNADTTSAGFTSPAPAARIFPNPVTTDLNLLIDMPENGAVTLRIFTPTGREMTSYHGESRDGTSVLHINTQSWPAGTYVYQLLLNNKTVISDKFLKN